jgi:predicted DNA-binding WGR domain protein
MKLVQQRSLHFKEGNSDKVYEVDLCEVGTDQYVVNFRYGKRGTSLQEGSKTPSPVALDKAQKLFDGLVQEKTKKGYQDVSDQAQSVFEGSFTPSKQTDPKLARAENIIENLRLAADSLKLHAKRRWNIKRVMWRAGELRLAAALPYLLQLLGKGDALHDYCCLWALGRCYEEKSHEAHLTQLSEALWAAYQKAPQGDKLQRIAASSLSLVHAEQLPKALQDALLSRLPEGIRDKVLSMDAGRLSQLLCDYRDHRKKHNLNFFTDLYLLSRHYPGLRRAFYEVFQAWPLRAGSFHIFRHVYKIAEHRNDAQILGLLFYLIESQTGTITKVLGARSFYDASLRRSISPKAEVAKADSAVAFSQKTRAYFLERAKENLAAIAESGDAQAYVHLATSLLLQYKDSSDAGIIQENKRWDYSLSTHRYHSSIDYFDTYADRHFFYTILHKNSKRYVLSGNRYRFAEGFRPMDGQGEGLREEAYPEYWDQYPTAWLHLLMEGQSERVLDFALKRLQAHEQYPQFLARFDRATAEALLRKPFSAVQGFGLDLLRRFYNPAEPDLGLLIYLLGSSYGPARTQGMAWVAEQEEQLLQNITFLKNLLMHPALDVRAWLQDRLAHSLQVLSHERRRAFIGLLIGQIMGISKDEGMATLLTTTLAEHFAEELKSINVDILGDLLQHPLALVQNFANHCLLQHQVKPEQLAKGFYLKLLQSANAENRRTAIALLERSASAFLMQQVEWLLPLCLHRQVDLRQGLRRILRPLWQQEADLGGMALQFFLPHLLKKEPFGGLHENIYLYLTEDLEAHLHLVDRKMIFRLLNSEHQKAQDLSATLLQRYIDPHSMSVRNIIRLADHEILAVRQVAWDMFERQVPRMKYEAEEAIRLLDAKWDDSRSFAFAYFKRHFTAQDWTPQLLIAIVDTVRMDVQAYGRQLITQFFNEENGEEYLLKLSQHPRHEIQLYVTNYLERFAADNTTNLYQLEMYFISTLSQVNKARVAKERIMNFLHQEGLKDEQAARLVVEIFNRLSATGAVEDRARSIVILRDLHLKYPHLEVLIKLQHPEVLA